MKSATSTGLAALSALVGCILIRSTSAQALAEPPAGKFLFGVWPQLEDGYQETPALVNDRTGFLFPAFQLSQRIPVLPYDFVTGVGGPIPAAYIEATGTDADIYLTVYPYGGLNVSDADLLSLALQVRTYQGSGKTVFLRWAPEFGGDWMTYGLQPTEFVATWIRMHDIIKAEAPDTVLVWSPNTGYSYPYGATLASVASAADRAALDTNGDGQLTGADDPYAPYYPGDEYVDWIGLSLYYKGPNFVNQNTNQPAGFIYDIIHGGDPFNRGNGIQVDWYEEYCVQKPTKACMLSEAGAAWHSDPALVASADNTQVELQRAWWNDGPLNQSFLQEHPRLRAYFQFEYDKFENDGGIVDERDYRITNNTEVLAAFVADMSAVSTNYVWANMTTSAAPNTMAFEITPSGPIATATVTVDNSATITATYTQFYSGPFVDVPFVGTADPLASPTGTSTLPTSAVSGIVAAGNGDAAAPTGPSLFTGSASSSRAVGVSTAVLAALAGAVAVFAR